MKAAAAAAAEERRRQAEIKSKATSTRVVPKLTVAPRGVPTIVDWRQRRDGTIEGKIFGSPNFDDGDRVETSAIVDGDVSNGSVVKTGSGSKYFLSDDQKIKEQNKKAALKAIGSAKKGATISLSFFGLKDDDAGESSKRDAEVKSRPSPSRAVPKLTVAPRGVPTIVDWRQRRDGTIEGKIFGSPNFDDGDRVETSAIVDGDVSNGSVVKTGSGSKYFLSDDQKIKEQNKKAALKAIGSAKKGATISLSFFGSKEDDAPSPTNKAGPTKAPKGVPSMVNWRKNGDGSISGFISGSPNFPEGERITTSPIASGTVKAGEVVKTGSGSKYFLV